MERRVKGLVLWASISVMSVGCGVEDARIEIQDRRDTENSGPPDLNSDLMEQLDQGAGSYPGDGDGDTGDGDSADEVVDEQVDHEGNGFTHGDYGVCVQAVDDEKHESDDHHLTKIILG